MESTHGMRLKLMKLKGLNAYMDQRVKVEKQRENA